MAPPGKKRRTGARAAGVGYVGLGFLLFFAISSTADGSLFKRKQQVQQQPPGSGGRGGKSRGGKRGKVGAADLGYREGGMLCATHNACVVSNTP